MTELGKVILDVQPSFDYSDFSESLKIKSIERKSRIKANEQIATNALYDIALDVKQQRDEMNNYKQWLKWCELELGYKSSMSNSLLKIAKELSPYKDIPTLPKTFKGLEAVANILAKTDNKQEFIEQIDQKTQEKGESLTEKEIKTLAKDYEDKIRQLENEKDDLQLKFLDYEKEVEKKILEAKKEGKKEVYQKEKEQLEKEKTEITRSIEALKKDKENIKANLGFLRQYQEDSIVGILSDFKKIKNKFSKAEATLVMPPTEHLLNQYLLVIKEFRLYADILEKTVAQVNFVDINSRVDNSQDDFGDF